MEAPKPHTGTRDRSTQRLFANYLESTHTYDGAKKSRHVVLACAAYKHKAGGVSWVDGGSSPAEAYARVIASRRQRAKHFSRQRLS